MKLEDPQPHELTHELTQERIQRAIALVCLWLGAAIGFAAAALLFAGGNP